MEVELLWYPLHSKRCCVKETISKTVEKGWKQEIKREHTSVTRSSKVLATMILINKVYIGTVKSRGTLQLSRLGHYKIIQYKLFQTFMSDI